MYRKAKFVELIEKSLIAHVGKSCKLAENIAGDLIANGVTLQEWISVKDRLPIEEVKKYRGETGEDPEFNVMIKGGLVPTSLFFNGEYWYCNFNDSYAVTHWAPLPQPPKGE